MTRKRHYYIIIGSKAYFDVATARIETNESKGFLELVRLMDNTKLVKNLDQRTLDSIKAQILIIKNDNYHGIVDAAHDRLGGLIEELTTDTAKIYVHNPPQQLSRYLSDQFERQIIDLDIDRETYKIKREPESFLENIEGMRCAIIGQDKAIDEISKSLWYLTSVERKKPYVIMLYGNSSLGKTELVREIAERFFDGKFLEKHLSMFKNNNYSDYFFGDAPNRRSIGFDLLERESNLVFLDEIDKCPEYFYSAFYTLFDNTLFKDATYDVDISGTIIVLTSNYQTEDEMKTHLGLPIYYRIDKFIHFADFSSDVVYKIAMKEIETRQNEYCDKYTIEDVYREVSSKLSCEGKNARTIKYSVQQVIEDLLFKEIYD